MVYSLNLWTSPSDENDVRVYINGTTRSAVYFKHNPQTKKTVWSSKANDTPAKFRSGNHYGKVNKDRDAALEVAEAFGFELGDDAERTEWTKIVETAKSGLQVEG